MSGSGRRARTRAPDHPGPMTPTARGTAASTSVDEATIRAAAARLRDAAESRTPCPPVRDLIGADDVAAAYAVQRAASSAADRRPARRVVGRKIGLTSPAVQAAARRRPARLRRALRRHGPRRRRRRSPSDRLLQPKVEAEIAFVLGADLADGALDDAQVRAAVGLRRRRARDRRQPHRRLGHHLRRHRRRQRLQRRSTSSATERRTLDEFEPVDVEMTHDASTARSSPPAPAPPASATRSTRWPGWPAPPATSASRCAPARSCSPAPSARWCPSRAGDAVTRRDHRPRRRSPPRFSQEGQRMTQDQGRHHRLRQHRHRPDDQGAAALRDPRDGRHGRHRPRLRRARPRRAARRPDDRTTASTG